MATNKGIITIRTDDGRLVEAYCQFAHEERRSQLPALRWVGWRWLVAMALVQIWACALAHVSITVIAGHRALLQHARGIVEHYQ
jgi:hypothetical protein